MHLLWLLLTAAAASAGNGPLRPSWERIYDGGGQPVLGPIHAKGRDDWIAAGGRAGLVVAQSGAVRVEDTHGHGVLGFFAEAPGSLYAFGEGELIWHLDGKTWVEEHIAPRPGPGRRPFAAHMVYVGFIDPSPANARVVAVGLEQALVRQEDGTWASPPAAERALLRDAGLMGPQFPAPAGCARATWHWLGLRRGAFTCHDGRLFTWDAGVVAAKGKLPGPCRQVLDALAEGDGEGVSFASCSFATLWRAEGGQWRRVVPPGEKGLREIGSISWAQGCLFVAGKHALWRTCGL